MHAIPREVISETCNTIIHKMNSWKESQVKLSLLLGNKKNLLSSLLSPACDWFLLIILVIIQLLVFMMSTIRLGWRQKPHHLLILLLGSLVSLFRRKPINQLEFLAVAWSVHFQGDTCAYLPLKILKMKGYMEWDCGIMTTGSQNILHNGFAYGKKPYQYTLGEWPPR